jgi:hypothetical protein
MIVHQGDYVTLHIASAQKADQNSSGLSQLDKQVL